MELSSKVIVTVKNNTGKIGRKSFDSNYALVNGLDERIIYARGESVQICFDYQTNTTMPVSDDLKLLLTPYLEKPARYGGDFPVAGGRRIFGLIKHREIVYNGCHGDTPIEMNRGNVHRF